MAERPDPALGRLTSRLSRLLSSGDGTQTLAVIQRLGFLARGAPATDDGSPPEEPLRFGIWEPVQSDDESVDFVRNEAFAGQWRFWADVERIRPRQGPRVLLLGESVARGYLYDPAINPACVLQEMLRTVPGLEASEVVDLARTDLGIDDLETMLDLLPALEPDVVVLFAGNNWHNVRFRVEHLQALADALRSDGYPALRQTTLEDVVLPRARRVLEGLAESLRPFGIPVALIVPEFNLRDWRSEPEVLVPVLPDGGNEKWMRWRSVAQGAVAEGRLEDAERAARAMISIDRGTSALSQNLLADALVGSDRQSEARSALEAARDAVYGLPIAHSPRCPSAVQRVLREAAAELGFAVVDLPAVLAARRLVPDRHLLLDYCHLTIEGMRIAMAATAQTLVGMMGFVPPPIGELEAVELGVDAEDEALAHLLAAVHNAHWGQGPEVVGHHCRLATKLAPRSVQLLLAYADAQSRCADMWLSRSFDDVTTAPNVRRYLGVNASWLVDKLADFELVEAVVEALEATGTQARERIGEILRVEHGSASHVDLLDPRYRATTFRQRAGYSLGQERAYHRALDLTSRFFLVRDRPEPIVFKVTCRLPGGAGEVAVHVNGTQVGAFDAGRQWRTHELTIGPEDLVAGVNRVALIWPLLPPAPELIEEDARRIERGVYPDVLPTYGELHAFTATGLGAPS